MPLPKPVQDLIDGSGNSFHAKVAQWFAANGWSLQISPYYLDQNQQKAREIDLIAERVWPFRNGFDQHQGHVVVRLFIECKFVPSAAVFWFADKDMAAAKGLVCSLPGFLPEYIHTQSHHYLHPDRRAAKLFTSSQTKGQEADLFYKALNQVLNGLVALRHRSSPIEERLHGDVLTQTYPVIVCSSFDEVYAADFLGKETPSAVRKNFQLEVQYAYSTGTDSSRNEHFLVDVVEFARLLDLTSAIEQDVRSAIQIHAQQ